MSAAQREREVEMGRRVHARLLDVLGAAVDAGLDGASPSLLDGWNRSMLITHLARNADSHRRMIDAAGRGEVVDQYEGGLDGRNDGIDAGTNVSAADALAGLRAATAALEASWEQTDWVGSGRRTIAGAATPIERLPFLRTREVELHLIDLDVGVGLADLDGLYVRLELSQMQMRWRARQPMGMGSMPDAVRALTPTDRVGWLTGRRVVPGADPAGLFGA